MKWFQHSTDSHDDPDISDAEDQFGDAGYNIFFKILEIYGREFNQLNSDGWLRISRTFLRRKLRKSWTKVEVLLNFYQERQRIYYKIDGLFVNLIIPRFIEISSNWMKRKKEKSKPSLQSAYRAPTAKEKEEKKNINIYVEGDESLRLSEYLFSKILLNNPKAKKPNYQVWAKQIDLMIRIDKREIDDIQSVIDWCQDDSFWKINILSTVKLRQQFDRLYLQMVDSGCKDISQKPKPIFCIKCKESVPLVDEEGWCGKCLKDASISSDKIRELAGGVLKELSERN